MFQYPLAPPSASNWAAPNDAIFYAILGLTVFFTAAVMIAILYFVVRYREGTRADRSRPVYEALALELTWTIVPTILALVIFYFAAKLYVDERTPPKNPEDIFVVGKQWMWQMEHRNGVRENNVLHVPLDRPVRLTMISQDVIHAFYVPAFRSQWMVVPGRYTQIWFTPTLKGEFHLFCNMYCGTQHSEMGGKVVVMDQQDYAKWLANEGEVSTPMTMEQAGARVYAKIGCENCHGSTDTPRAPSLYGIYGKLQKFSNAPPAKVDDELLRSAILRPYDQLVTGYDQSMPAYEGQITESDVLHLVAYIRSIAAAPPAAEAGITDHENAVTSTSHLDATTSMAVNSLRARTPDTDATPTIRNNTPAVGSIAARGRNE